MRGLLASFLFLLVPSLALAFGGSKAEFDESGRFLLASDIPQEQRDLFRKDLAYLNEFRLASRDEELERVLGWKESDGLLVEWLAARARIFVGESFDPHSALVTVAEPFSYENPFVLPNLERYPTTRGARPEEPLQTHHLIAMSNLGTSIYLRGKSERRLYGVTVPGGELVPVSTPRVGILQVGRGHFFFALERFGAQRSSLDSEAYSVLRLATLFHEARHSDGNGESLGFLHALCPPDHDYAHTYSCDRNVNGPYMVGGLIARTLLAQCKTCTAAEREALRLEALDSFQRVIRETSNPRYVSADPAMHELCEAIREQNRILNDTAPLPEACIPPNGGEGVLHSTYWDARPEGAAKQEPK